MRKTCRKHLSPPGSGSGRRSWRVLDLAHEKTHEPHPTNTFQNTSHARKLNIFSFVPSIAPSVRKVTSIEILKFFQYLLLAFSYLVSRWSIACLELVCMPGLKQFAVIFEPFFFLWRCHSASNDHPKASALQINSGKKKTPQKLGIPKNSKKLRPMPRHKRRASLSSEPGCEKNIDEDSQIPHDGTP